MSLTLVSGGVCLSGGVLALFKPCDWSTQKNIVTNHKTAFFCVDQSQGSKSARTPPDRQTPDTRVSDIMKASLLRRAALKTMLIVDT